MGHPLIEFTPERWEAAKRVLSGEDDEGVSWTAAAKAAGVSVSTLQRWVKRSQERLPEDDPLVHEIAEFCEGIDDLQGQRLEDVAWKRAVYGEDEPVYYKGERVDTKLRYDNKLLMRMLETRNPRYRTKDATLKIGVDDAAEIFRRLTAGKRIAEAQNEETALQAPTIDLQKDEDDIFSETP